MSRTLYYTVIVSLGGFIFGFDASVISGVVGFVTVEFNLDEIQQGLVVTAPTWGGLVATFTAGVVCDAIGRRKTLMIIAFLYVLSALVSAVSTSFEMLFAARFIGGLAFCSLMIAPLYIAEISSSEKRGRMVSINQLNIVLGFSAAYFANYFILMFSQSDASWVSAIGLDAHTWRWMLGIEVIPAIAYFGFLFLIPESPRWLVVNGHQTQASRVMSQLFSVDEAKVQLNAITESIGANTVSWTIRLKELISAKLKFALLIGVVVAIVQQAVGINAIFFYAPTIFEQSGVGTNAAFMQAALVGIINVVFTIVAMMLIDKLGRKPLLLSGLLGVFVSMSIITFGFSQATYKLDKQDIVTLSEQFDVSTIESLVDVEYDNDVDFKNEVKQAIGSQEFATHQGLIIEAAVSMNALLILFGICAFVASFAVSLGPVMWVLVSEIFPNSIRGIAISMVIVVNTLVSALVQFVFPLELTYFGSATTFMLYGIVAIIGFFCIWKVVPETKSKSLEELEVVLGTKSS